MSYCRWSSDDFQCDVYVYAHVNGGWTIHVAGGRKTPDAPRPAPLDHPDWWNHGEAGVVAFMNRQKAVREWVDTAPMLPIGLPHDNETLTTDTPSECADQLERLREIGYNVPQYAIDALREEAATNPPSIA